MADGKIEVEIDVKNENYKSAFNELTSAATSSASSVSTQLQTMGKSLSSFGSSATKTLTVPIAAAATASIAAAVKIDDSLTSVRKTVDGTEEDYQNLKDAAIEFSKTNAVSADQILDIEALGAQLGYSLDELQDFGEVVSGLDIATDLDAETAATELAQFANITKMAHSESQNYASTLVELGNTSATTESSISAMAMRIAAAGTQVGMSQADILGLAAALSSMGIEAEAGGTAISTIMSRIDSDIAKNTDSVQVWAETAGMSAEEFATAWETNPVEALTMLLSNMDAATESGGNMSLMLEDLGISAIRQTDVMKRLAGNSELVTQTVETANSAWVENSALTNEVANRNESLSAKFEMLKNKGIAVLEQVGTPLANALLNLADAAQPVIDAIEDVANQFNEMDSGTQQVILGFVGLLAAIGPVTSVVGKLMQGVGSGIQTFTKFKTKITEVANSAKTAATNLTASSGAVTKYATQVENGQKQIVKWDSATQKYVATEKTMGSTILSTNAGIKAQQTAQVAATSATKLGTTAMKAASTAAKAFGSALKTIAPMAIMGVAIEVFTRISSAIEDANEKTENYKKATEGLTSAIDGVAEVDVAGSMEQAAAAMSDAGDTAESTAKSVDELAEAQAGLADSLTEDWNNVQAQSASVTAFTSVIEQLADKENLTAEEQAQLTTAVAGYNQVTGESVEVVDAANGKLSESTDQILKNAEAWQKNAQAQVLQEHLVEIYNEQYDIEQSLAEAQSNLANAQNELNDCVERGKNGDYDAAQAQGQYETKVRQAREAVDELQGLLTANQEEVQKVSDKYVDLSASTDEATASIDGNTAATQSNIVEYNSLTAAQQEESSQIQGLIAGNSELQGSMDGIDISNLANKLVSLGFSYDDLNAIGSSDFAGLADACNGSMDDMVAYCQAAGIDVPQNLSMGIQSGAGDVYVATGSMAEQALSAITDLDYTSTGAMIPEGVAQGIISNTSDVTAMGENGQQVMDALRDACDVHSPSGIGIEVGSGIGEGVTQGINDSAPAAIDAVNSMGQSIMDALQNAAQNTQSAGQQAGQNFVNGVLGSSGGAQSAGSSLSSAVISGFSTALGQATSSGNNIGSNFANGIKSQAGTVKSNCLSIVDNIKSAFQTGVTPAHTIGHTLGNNFAQGIHENNSTAKSMASALVSAATSALNTGSSTARSYGSELGAAFANGISSQQGAVSSAATSLANAAKSVLGHSIPKTGPLHEGGKGEKIWGQHFVENFAQGMLDGVPSIDNAIDSVANQLYKQLSSMESVKIPVTVDAVEIDTSSETVLKEILSGYSDASLMSGNQSISGVLNRCDSIIDSLTSFDSQFDAMNEKLSNIYDRLGEPTTMSYNRRELGRMVRDVL